MQGHLSDLDIVFKAALSADIKSQQRERSLRKNISILLILAAAASLLHVLQDKATKRPVFSKRDRRVFI